MILVGYTEFRSNLKKYLQIALNDKVVLQSNGMAFDITPSKEIRINPSPSNDPWFDNPQNMAELDKAMEELKDIHSGKVATVSWDDLKANLGL